MTAAVNGGSLTGVARVSEVVALDRHVIWAGALGLARPCLDMRNVDTNLESLKRDRYSPLVVVIRTVVARARLGRAKGEGMLAQVEPRLDNGIAMADTDAPGDRKSGMSPLLRCPCGTTLCRLVAPEE